jgi:hypothetical protein
MLHPFIRSSIPQISKLIILAYKVSRILKMIFKHKLVQMEPYEGRVQLHVFENTKFMNKVGSKLKINLIGPNISRFHQNL